MLTPAQKKAKEEETPLKPLPDTPNVFRKVVKHNIRSNPQLKFDMEVTKFIVSTGQPFSIVNNPGFHSFVKYLDPKVIVKEQPDIHEV